MLASIDVKFIFDSASTLRIFQLRKYSPNSRCRPSSCLLAVLAMFLAIISPSSYSRNLETSEMSAHFVFTTKTTQPRPRLFSVNGALTCKRAARQRFIKRRILPNLVISS